MYLSKKGADDFLFTKHLSFKSNDEFYKACEPYIEDAQHDLSKRRLPLHVLVRALLRAGDFCRLDKDGDDCEMFFPDYDKREYSSDIKLISRHLAQISTMYKQHTFSERTKLYDMVVALSDEPGSVILYHYAPRHLTLLKNGIYDLEKMEYTDETSDADGEYFFVETRNFDVVDVKTLEPKWVELVNYVRNQWSSNDTENRKFIDHLTYAGFIGLNAKRVVVIRGEGGNGKSSYLNELTLIAGQRATLPFNLHDLDLEYKVALIQNYHRILTGDDLKTKWYMGANASTLFKSLLDGIGQIVNVKYDQPRNIKFGGLWVQATNHAFGSLEKGQMMNDRLLMFPWGSTNHRHNNESRNHLKQLVGYSLDQLLSSYNEEATYKYLTTTISMIVHSLERPTAALFTDYAEKYEEFLKEALDETKDSFGLFIDELDYNETFTQAVIPVSVLFKEYLQFCNQSNLRQSLLSAKSFSLRLKDVLLDRDFILLDSRQRISSIKPQDYNIREHYQGAAPSDLKNTSYSKELQLKTVLYKNPKPTAPLLTHSIEDILAEAVMDGMTDNDVFSMSPRELREFLEKNVE